jgi:DNA-binding transcriptional LysR family regulator
LAAQPAALSALSADLQALLASPRGFDAMHAERVFPLASTDYVAATLLGPLAARLGAQASSVQLAVVSPDSATLLARLTAAEIDAALLVRGRAPRGLRSTPLFDEDFVFAVAKDHPLARKRRLGAADVAAAPQVYISPRDASFTGQADQALRAQGLTRFVRLSVPSFAAAVDVIEHSDLAAILPRRVAAAAACRVASRPLPFVMSGFTMEWVTHPRADNDAAIAWLRDEVLAAWNGLRSL